ncbi:leucine-rich repeat receptor protein kinase HPCA1-like [Juglans microcarpa x Juglans regia]|uniref:leucine-rich repeat receptor protein kinase HPCA1-like n=1 Tax=Juglans microcarpa x Juglans regia TaxID=2249226 RepID=UPI001B7E6226|nr:leucine-rich repeat receptor protein kinase HPCA1-like [Juglans microcarpa x Juglans regia]
MCRKSTGMKLQLLFLALFLSGIHFIDSFTDPQDVAVLIALKATWKNTPPSWGHSDDPCGLRGWEGVTCNNSNSRVTALKLSTMGLEGKLEGDIGGLAELKSLDLSFNRGLTGSLSPQLGDLKKLNFLILAGCSFTGDIPEELGNLSDLRFLALNSNNLTGKIPPSFGNFAKLFWLDVAENMLTGPLPISTSMGAPGLDLLLKARHFHFNKNKLSGPIPAKLFSSNMSLIHILFDGNQLSGSIPPTLGLIKTLEVLRLDRNALTGSVPDLSNLTNIIELNFAQNKLTGALPDLTQMMKLNYLDLSNNSFEPSEAPTWFSTLRTLTTLVMEYGSLQGPIPRELFSLPQLQQVKLRNNEFNETLDMGAHEEIRPQLKLIDLQNNDISFVKVGTKIPNFLKLKGNPVCNDVYPILETYCQQNHQPPKPYSTSLANCESTSCPLDQNCNPRNCECAYPYKGTLYVGGSLFSELSNATVFNFLECSLWVNLSLLPRSVSILSTGFNFDDYLQVQLAFFPSTGKYFNRSEIQRIGFLMTTQQYRLPLQFGAYFFIADPYAFPAKHGGTSIGTRVIIEIAIACCAILVLGLLGVGIYAVRQKRRAEAAIGFSNPFASWRSSGNDSSGAAPQLKGARLFSYYELRKCTNNFAERNEIGSGAYGKVYRGLLSDGLVVAIKRAQQGSTQGLLEFKTEIELLSRVHHKNLVGLVGFCFEQGEQMLVYEFMPNGTIRDSLSRKSGIYLDWNRRLYVALGSARGLAYLHEHANPPIIHRDIKSTNILLDENLTAKVADFGLSKLVSDDLRGHISTQVKGTMGYLDPEYYQTQKLTEKSDVYSFGVFMLELLTSKRPIERGMYIVRQVRTTMNKDDEEHYGLWDMIDSSIRDTPNLIGFGQFLEITMKCIEDSPEDRPTMSEVVKAFETILQNDGMALSTSALSSTSDLGASKLSASKHSYKDVSSIDIFDYSGAYIVSSRVEPK